jgi:HEAT repeat protein
MPRAGLVMALMLLASLALAKPAAGPARVARPAVESRLRNYKPDPAGWRALGAGTDQVLVDIGGDAKAEPLLRARAVTTLGYFSTPAARKFLETTIASKASSRDPTDRQLVSKAAVSLGWLGGVDVPGRLAPLLEHEDPDVRLDAAIGLGLTRLDSAAASLRKRVEVEEVPRVRAQISRQIKVIEDARAAAAAGK